MIGGDALAGQALIALLVIFGIPAAITGLVYLLTGGE